MGKNISAKGDNAATVVTTQKSTPRTVTCRCCLSEADGEVTDFLPLDSPATICVRLEYENDDAAKGDESSSISASLTAATLLDCLNGCARIGATLKDASLPLHICLDCSQALEACCEFIRCVQNADQILRRKRREAMKKEQMATGCTNDSVVDPIAAAAATTDENHLTYMESISAGTLNFMDFIDEAVVNEDSNCMRLPTLSYSTTVSDVYENSNKNANFASNSTTNACGIRPFEQIIQNTAKNSFRSSKLPLNAIIIDFDFQKASNSSNAILDNDGDIASRTNLANNNILNAHKFIPPFDKDNSISCNVKIPKEQTILNKDFMQNSIERRSISDETPSGDINSLKYSKLECGKRKYIVNAEIVKDLVKFHMENKGKHKYVCMFCEFSCDNKQMWDQHLTIHLGVPRYKCSQCNFECRYKYYLARHFKKVHRMSATEMHLKPKLDDVSTSLTNHYCSLCQLYFTSFIALQQHHHIDEDPYFKCTHCHVSETKRENLMEHLAMEHKVFIDAKLIAAYIPNSTKPANKTEDASNNKIFLNQFIKFPPKDPKLNVHLCQYCGKNFQRRFHLLKHEHYVHPNDNKLENEKYVKRRTAKYTRQQYTRHFRATQAENQFKCDICHRLFKSLADRSAHVHQDHSTYFQCATCEATFAFEFELKYHMRTHNTRACTASSALASPRYDHHITETSNSISEELKNRLHQLRLQKQIKNLALSNSTIKRSRPITKRRLSLASVSTNKSSESSVNSPSNTNSDEDMASVCSAESSKIITALEHNDIDVSAISVADVMLPQPMQRATTMRRLSTSSILSLGKFCSTNYNSSTVPSSISHEPPCTPSERSFNCDFNDQPYLNDFDLNLLDDLMDFTNL